MATVLIQGIECHYRDLRESTVDEHGTITLGEEILYSNLPQDDQYFRRVDVPFTDDELIEIASVPFDDRKGKYNNLQRLWVEREESRMTYGNGVYSMINGVQTYIPASYWCYVNHWTLEHGEKPEYRESDRIFFLLMEYLYFETEVLGITRGKGRRQGASSLGYFWQWWICGREANKIGGSLSFDDTAAQANFQSMFMRGFKEMLPCFVRDFDSKAENFVRFVKPTESAKKGVNKKREGLNSYCNFKANSINAYDSGRVSFLLPDETGKYHRMDINTYWSKVSPTLKVGRDKVGMAYMPTTVNPKNKGGEHYKQFWTEANQNAINDDTGLPYGLNTPHKVVRYFVPATEGYGGCIDKFGNSVIEDPIEPIMGNKGKWITEGSLSVIKKERSLKKGEQKMEHRRDFPLDEYDMFAFESGQCEFNEDNFIKRIEELERNPQLSYWRQCRIYDEWDQEENKLIVKFADDKKGECWLNELPRTENNYYNGGGIIEPRQSEMFSAGADTYRNIFAVNGSDGAIVVMKKSCIIDGKETGLYPVFIFMGRPKLIKQFNRIAFLICLLYGCKINFEIDAGTWFYEDFLEWGGLGLLEWTPAVDLTKKNYKITPGTESANPFQLAKQLEVAKLYYDGNKIDGYNGNVHRVNYIPLLKDGLEYNHSERTPYHITVALMMALLPILGRPGKRNMAAIKPKSVLPTYKIKMVS